MNRVFCERFWLLFLLILIFFTALPVALRPTYADENGKSQAVLKLEQESEAVEAAKKEEIAKVAEAAAAEEEEAPIIWFIHGMILVRDDFEEEMAVLKRIFPNAETICMKRWNAPRVGVRTPEEHWEKSLIEAERFAKQIAVEIRRLPEKDRERLILVGHSLGGRIAVRALAIDLRAKDLHIRQLILAGAAMNFDDPDISEAVLASRKTVYNLVNASDVMLAAFKIAENQSALGTGCLYTLEPEEFFEIAITNSVNHYGYEYFEWLLKCIEIDDFSSPRIIIPQDASQLPLTTMGGETFWKNIKVYAGWKLQKNTITGHGRILDERDVRVASGRIVTLQKIFERIKQQRCHQIEFHVPTDSITFPELEPLFQFDSIGSSGFWQNLEQFRGWTLQKSCVTNRFRILDPQKCRRAFGSETKIRKTFQNLQSQLESLDDN